MKGKNFGLILLIIVLMLALMAAIYISGAVPSYNDVIDTAITDVTDFFNGLGNKPDQAEKTVTQKKESTSKKSTQKDGYELINGGYSLASVGKIRWIYESEWPFVTAPVVHDDTVVSVTAEPAFITLSVQEGSLVSRQECPVYPGEKAVFKGNVLTLTGRDGQTYLFVAEDDGTFTDMRAVESEEEALHFISQFAPSSKASDFMNTRLREWSADDERKLPEVRLYTGHINQEGKGNFWAQKNAEETVMYVFTPDKQGVYQVGLADENGAWIASNAFVAVFGENGDLKQVSLDYVANKPIIKLHLSDTEIYYIVAGWAKDMYDGRDTWLQIAESR